MIKRKPVGKYLKQARAVIICLQETHLKIGEAKWLKQIFPGLIYHASVKTRSKGVLLGIDSSIPWSLTTKIIDKDGRYVILIGK